MEEKFIGYFDGSSVPNPGTMQIGGQILDSNRKVVYAYSKPMGDGTNNQAEYLSLIELLKAAKAKGIKRITIQGDSMLVVNQVNQSWKAKNSMMKRLQIIALELLEYFDEWELSHIYRENNKEADKLTR